MENKLLPVSEIFFSPQGEGVYTGVGMLFVRFAGCTVGKPYTKAEYEPLRRSGVWPELPTYTEKCTLADGRHMPCDTDYRVKKRLTLDQLLKEIPKDVEHICITGGEPLVHDLNTFISYLLDMKKKVHIETSGTIEKYFIPDIWVTVSPKSRPYNSMIERANEIKLLVDEKFNPEKPFFTVDGHIVYPIELAKKKIVYLHPINGEYSVDKENLHLCQVWQNKYKQFRIGVQMHKSMTAVLEEIVR